MKLNQPLKTFVGETAYEYAFSKFLDFRDYESLSTEHSRQYDSLGVIDTLGHSSGISSNSFSYSDEMGCIHAIQLNGLWFVCFNYFEKKLMIYKDHPYN